MEKIKNHTLGISMTLLSAFSFAILTAIVKAKAADVSVPVIVFIQSAVTLLLVMPATIRSTSKKTRAVFASPYIGLHLLRTIFSLGLSYLLFASVSYIPLVDAVLFANSFPLFLPFLAYLFLRKKINKKIWAPLFIGFVGIVLVLQPSPKNFNWAILLALAAAICSAFSMLILQKTSEKDSGVTTSFYYFLFSTLISGIVAYWFWIPFSFDILLILLLSGVLFFIVQFSLGIALQHISSELAGTLYYSNIIFAALIGIFIWGTELKDIVIVGIALTTIGGILCIRLQKESKNQPSVG